jgi:alpha/beta superfamily hydrolase
METFYFGEPPKLLFGAYHPAQEFKDRKVGVILCYPIINEYLRAHRAFVRLATQLAMEGFHVLRFDYFGCGDSYGDDDDGSLLEWTGNLLTAIDELKNGCDAAHICLIGLRMGASLALLAAEKRNDIDTMVLWEPIVNGEEYVREIKRLHLESAVIEGLPKAVKVQTDANRHLEILGFRITDILLDEILKLDFLSMGQSPAKRVLHIENSDDYDRRDFVNHLKHLGTDVEEANISCASIWLEGDNESYAGLVPVNALEHIVKWVMERYS